MFDKLHLKQYNKNGRPYLNNVRYDKDEGVYVSTNGHIMLIEKTTDIREQSCNIDMMTGQIDYEGSYPEWQKVVPSYSDPLPLKGNLYRLKADAPRHCKIKYVVGFEVDIWFDAKYLQRVVDFCGEGARFYWEDPQSPILVQSVDNERKAVLMPMRGPVLDNYEAESEWTFASKSKTLKKVYIVKNESGFIRVFSTLKKAEDCRYNLADPSEIITDYLY